MKKTTVKVSPTDVLLIWEFYIIQFITTCQNMLAFENRTGINFFFFYVGGHPTHESKQ